MIKSTDLLFTLLRLSLNAENTSVNICSSTFSNVTNEDWEKVFKLSVKQGILLLCYGGWQYLPEKLQPFRKLKLRWCANVIKAGERYNHYKTVIERLSTLLSQNHIKLIIIKGITISELYPTPFFREIGDVDVFLIGNATKADYLLSSVGIKNEEGIPKHSTFNLDGVSIENHYTLFDTILPFRRERQLYLRMEKMLEDMLTDCAYIITFSDKVFQLPPQAAALYLIGHTFRHFCCLDMNIRQLCDWTIFFTKNREEIDCELLSVQINELGLTKFVSHINSVCSGYLGFKPYFINPVKADKQAERFIVDAILKYKSNPIVPVWSVLQNLFHRNRIYKRYLGKIHFSEFLLPEIKSYFTYKLRGSKVNQH